MNELNRHVNIQVIFTNEQSKLRNSDFYKGNKNFKYSFLDNTGLVKRFITLLRIIRSNTYDEIIICGWDQILFFLVALVSAKRKNSVVIESSIYESVTTGYKGIIKRLFLSRIQKAYCSGTSQSKILDSLNFKGEIIITKGVGIFNIKPQPLVKCKDQIKNFVYVGRFSEEKNLKFIIDYFNGHTNYNLHLFGFGPLEKELKAISGSTVYFHGAIANENLHEKLQEFDVLILPSKSEPWGLVVEEALNSGLPVLVSDKVGCIGEVVTDEVGIIFKLGNATDFDLSIKKITNIDFYNSLQLNISKLNFNEIAEHQIKSYLKNTI